MEQIKKRKSKLMRWLNYTSLVKQVPFILFLSLLAVVYIYNGHNADKTIRSIGKATNELKDLQGEYKFITGDVLLRSRQSELVETVKPLGLNELKDEPTILIDSSGE
jgi:hypothetical protein